MYRNRVSACLCVCAREREKCARTNNAFEEKFIQRDTGCSGKYVLQNPLQPTPCRRIAARDPQSSQRNASILGKIFLNTLYEVGPTNKEKQIHKSNPIMHNISLSKHSQHK